jgi:hypothetical protein
MVLVLLCRAIVWMELPAGDDFGAYSLSQKHVSDTSVLRTWWRTLKYSSKAQAMGSNPGQDPLRLAMLFLFAYGSSLGLFRAKAV